MRRLIEWTGRGSRLIAGVLMGLAWIGSLSAPLYAQQFAHIDPLFFSKGYGGANPLPQVLTVTSTGPAFGFTASASTSTGGDWLAVSPSGDCCMTPAQVSVTVSPSDTLAAGSYSGEVRFIGGGSSLIVNVTLVVAPSGKAVFDSTPGQLSFSMRPGGESPSQVMQIGNAGTETLNWMLIGSSFNGADFLSASAQTGTAPTQITLRVLPEKLPNGGATAGVYTGQLLFLAAGSTVTVPVRVLVGDSDSNAANSPGSLKPVPGARSTPLAGTTNLYPANTMNVVCGGFININTAYGGYDTSQFGAPDGSRDSARLITEANPGSGAVEHSEYRSQDVGAGTWSVSFHFKLTSPATTSWVYIRADVNHVTQRAWFNLANGTAGTIPAGWTPQITALTNGWYRFAVTITVAPAQNASFGATGFGLAPGDNQYNYIGSTSNGVYEFGQQFESGAVSSYQPNVGPCLEFTKVADATSVAAGSPIGYWMYLRNVASAAGGVLAAATSATINDLLTPGATSLNWSVSQPYTGPGICNVTGAPGSQTLACALGDLAANAAALVMVHVTSGTTASSCGSYSNTATASATNASPHPATASTAVTCGSPGLSISKTHTGNFTQGQTGATYTVTVSNVGAAPTSGTVTVTDTAPTGLTVASMSGTGWGCLGNTCTRSDALAAGASYPVITVTVNVSATAASPVTNQVSVSGGGSASANASDLTSIGTNSSTDLALGKAATQSSTASFAIVGAGGAVDGNTDGNYSDGSVTHTNSDANAWWQVDLGASATVGSIVIWNRTDNGVGNRLSDYWVFVSNTPFGPSDTPATLQNRAGTWSSHQTVAPNPSTSISVPGYQGRYVRVQLSGTNYLSLAEVQVFGTVGNATNLSVGKTATQSSTASFAIVGAAGAVDGNTDGNYSDGSVTHTNSDANAWWQVDLGASAAVSSIVIWNRTDNGVGNRLSDYWVFVSDTPFGPSDTPATLQNRAGTWSSHQTVAPNPSTSIVSSAQGRYVRVQLSGTNYLSLAEVQVFGTTASATNLSVGKAATQSSTASFAIVGAGGAVDGNTDGNYSDGSVTHTNSDANAWWQVDLGASAAVSSIVIWNRTDNGVGNRLSDYWVFVSDTPFGPADTPATLQNRAGTWSSHQTVAPNPSTSIASSAQGRYVRVQLSGTNYLSLAEVQVFGTTASSANLSVGKVATQSSTASFAIVGAGGAVDGNTDGNYSDGSVTHTNSDANAWWQVDLGASATVNSIVIWNRTDGGLGYRLSDYWVFVSNTPFAPSDTPATLQNRAGTWSSHQTVAPSPSTSIVSNAQGRYVRVQLSGTNYLSLAEVQVFGN